MSTTTIWATLLLSALGQDRNNRLEPNSAVSSVHLSDNSISAIACSPDGKFLAAGAEGNSGIIDLSPWALTRLETFAATPNGFSFSRDGTWLIAAVSEGQAISWNRRNGFMARRLNLGGEHTPIVSFVGPDDDLWLSRIPERSTQGGMSHFRESVFGLQILKATEIEDQRDDVPGHYYYLKTGPSEANSRLGYGPIQSIATSMRSTFGIATTDRLEFWNTESRHLEYVVPFPSQDGNKLHFYGSNVMALAKNGMWAIAADRLGRHYVWDIEKRREVMEFIGPASRVRQITSSPDGDVTASLTEDGIIHIWNWTNRTYGTVAAATCLPTCIALPRVDVLAMGTANGDVRIFSNMNGFLSRDGFRQAQIEATKSRRWRALDNAVAVDNLARQLPREIQVEGQQLSQSGECALNADGNSNLYISIEPTPSRQQIYPESDDIDLSQLKGVENIFQISFRRFNGRRLSTLHRLSRLQSLEFYDFSFQVSQLSELKGHPTLTELKLSGNFDDGIWKSLGELTNLEVISVYNGELNDDFSGKGIGNLLPISGLRELNIYNHKTIHGISAFAELAQARSLRVLSIRNYQTSEADREQLLNWFPKCQVHLNGMTLYPVPRED